MNRELQDKQKELEGLEKKIRDVKDEIFMLKPTLKDHFNLLKKHELSVFEQIYEEMESVDFVDNFNESCVVNAVDVAILLSELEDELEHWMEEK